MPIRRSPNSAGHTPPQPGRDRPERVVAINRNRWSQSIGISGRNQPVRAQIGTRNDINARWASRCMSKRERKEDVDLQILRLIRQKKWLRAERKIQKKLRGVAQQRRANEEAAIKRRNRKAAIEWENSRFISRYWKR